MKQMLNIDYKVIFITIIFTLLYIFVPNNKLLFAFSFVHLFILLFHLKDIFLTYVYLFLPWLVFESGRVFEMELVAKEVIESPVYESAIVAAFELSPLFIFTSVITIPLICLLFLRYKQVYSFLAGMKPQFKPLFLLLLLYLVLRLMSAINTEYDVFYALLYVYRESFVLIWFIALLKNLHDHHTRERIFKTIGIHIFFYIGIEVILALLQMVAGGYLGLPAERAHYVAQFGMGSDESESLLRVSGFWHHPNGLADWLFLNAVALVSLVMNVGLFKNRKNDQVLVRFFPFFLLIISAITLNRVSLVITIISFVLTWNDWHQKVFLLVKKLIYESSFLHKLIFFCVSIVLIIPALGRIIFRTYLTLFSFSEVGGFSTRFLQYQEALVLLFKKPFLGSGPNMYVPHLYQWLPNGEILYFPERVHNGFLLIAVESGVLSSLVVLSILLYVLLLTTYSRTKKLGFLLVSYTVLTMLLHKFDSHILSFAGVLYIVTLLYENEQKNVSSDR